MNNNRKSEIRLFRLSCPEEQKELYLGVDDDLSPDDLKRRYPQLHDYQFQQIPQYHPAETREQ